MINFRYHIVSITAVFLALGIGAALGSTFLDQSIVDQLDRNIRSAENRIRDSDAENDRLQGEADRARERDAGLILNGAPELFRAQLSDVPVLIVVAPGVDGGTVDTVRQALTATGADFRGSLQLDDSLAFAGDDLDQELADELGIEAGSVGDLRRAVYGELQAGLVAASTAVPAEDEAEDEGTGATPSTTSAPPTTSATTAPVGGPTDPSTTTEPESPGTEPPGTPDPAVVDEQPAVLTSLLARGYVRYDPPAGGDSADPILDAPGYRYVFVSGPGLEKAANDVLLRLLPADPTLAPPAVVVSATEPEADPDADDEVVPTAVARIRESEELRNLYSTVDDIDAFSGLAATVVVLERVGDVAPGHYGQGEGATAVLPPAP